LEITIIKNSFAIVGFVFIHKYVAEHCVIFAFNVIVVIFPENFEMTLRQYVSQGLPDLSVSRARARIPWGIPVPGDDSQTVCSN